MRGIFRSETSLRLLQLCKRILQRYFTVKLQKCFVEYETSPDFQSVRAGGNIDNFLKNALGELVL